MILMTTLSNTFRPLWVTIVYNITKWNPQDWLVSLQSQKSSFTTQKSLCRLKDHQQKPWWLPKQLKVRETWSKQNCTQSLRRITSKTSSTARLTPATLRRAAALWRRDNWNASHLKSTLAAPDTMKFCVIFNDKLRNETETDDYSGNSITNRNDLHGIWITRRSMWSRTVVVPSPYQQVCKR